MRARGDDLVNPADLLDILRVTYSCLVYAGSTAWQRSVSACCSSDRHDATEVVCRMAARALHAESGSR
jgi:hypothetical protein